MPSFCSLLAFCSVIKLLFSCFLCNCFPCLKTAADFSRRNIALIFKPQWWLCPHTFTKMNNLPLPTLKNRKIFYLTSTRLNGLLCPRVTCPLHHATHSRLAKSLSEVTQQTLHSVGWPTAN